MSHTSNQPIQSSLVWRNLFDHTRIAELCNNGDIASTITGVLRSPRDPRDLNASLLFRVQAEYHRLRNLSSSNANAREAIQTPFAGEQLPSAWFLWDDNNDAQQYLIAGNKVYNQGKTNKCVAYAGTTIREYQLSKQHPDLKRITLSKEEFWQLRRNQPAQAMYGVDGVRIPCEYGCVTEDSYNTQKKLVEEVVNLRESLQHAQDRYTNAKLLDPNEIGFVAKRMQSNLKRDVEDSRAKLDAKIAELKQISFLVNEQRATVSVTDYLHRRTEDNDNNGNDNDNANDKKSSHINTMKHSNNNNNEHAAAEKAKITMKAPHIYARVEDVETLRQSLYYNGPCLILLPYFKTMYRDHFWQRHPKFPNQTEGLGHCVTIVGYDDTKQEIWLRNSWGTSWGERRNGHTTMSYDEFNTHIQWETWTIFYDGEKQLHYIQQLKTSSQSAQKQVQETTQEDLKQQQQHAGPQQDSGPQQSPQPHPSEPAATGQTHSPSTSETKAESAQEEQVDHTDEDVRSQDSSLTPSDNDDETSQAQDPVYYLRQNQEEMQQEQQQQPIKEEEQYEEDQAEDSGLFGEGEEDDHRPLRTRRRNHHNRIAQHNSSNNNNKQSSNTDKSSNNKDSNNNKGNMNVQQQQKQKSVGFTQRELKRNKQSLSSSSSSSPSVVEQLQQKGKETLQEMVQSAAGKTLGVIDHAWNKVRPHVPCCH